MEILTNNLFINALAITILLLIVIVGYFKWSFTYWSRQGIFTHYPSIPFGNAGNVFRQKIAKGIEFRKFYETIKSRGERYGGYYIFTKPVFVPTDLDLIKRILITDFEHFTNHLTHVDEETDPSAANIFSLQGSKWKNIRNKLSPAFTSGKMKMIFSTLTERSQELLRVVDNKVKSNEALNIKDISTMYNIDTFVSCAFGIECNTLTNPNSEFKEYARKIFGATPWDSFLRILTFTVPEILTFFKLSTFRKDVSDFFMNLVKDTVRLREQNNIIRKDFMHLLIQLRNNVNIDENDLGNLNSCAPSVISKSELSLSMKEIAANALFFFVGGFETSSTTMTFCLYELVRNLKLQENVRDEINMVLGKYGGELTYDGINEMTYMDKCISETLRKYPPLPVLNRRCTKTYKIPNSDIILKEGSCVFIPAMGIQYDSDYYPDPEKFDPERFSKENKATRHSCAWIPFGAGPRICIGERLGVLQTKVGLATLLKNFRFSLNAKTETPLTMNARSVSLSPRSKIWLNGEKVT